jgi:hypothetical protein
MQQIDSHFTDSKLAPANANVLRPACFGRHVQTQLFELTDKERMDLDRLRWLAMRASLHGGENMDQACRVLASDKNQSFERFGEMFFHGLVRHSRHHMRLHKPRAKDLTGDEIWLVRLLRMYRHNDLEQAARMIAWHIPRYEQRWMRFLARGMADRI